MMQCHLQLMSTVDWSDRSRCSAVLVCVVWCPFQAYAVCRWIFVSKFVSGLQECLKHQKDELRVIGRARDRSVFVVFARGSKLAIKWKLPSERNNCLHATVNMQSRVKVGQKFPRWRLAPAPVQCTNLINNTINLTTIQPRRPANKYSILTVCLGAMYILVFFQPAPRCSRTTSCVLCQTDV